MTNKLLLTEKSSDKVTFRKIKQYVVCECEKNVSEFFCQVEQMAFTVMYELFKHNARSKKSRS